MKAIIQPRIAQAGKVRIQVITISLAIPHRTAERRLVAPTPIIAVLIQCVVLTGIPRYEEAQCKKVRNANLSPYKM